jgi:glycosyltransferase 2 family protein
VTLADLSGATIAPSDHQRRVDHAQALVTSVVIAGTERGLAAAHAALEAEGLAEVVPYLQMPALSRGLRPQARRAGVDLDELRQRAAELAGVRPADLQQLRRVTWSTLLQTGLLALALSALVSGLAGLDLEEIATQLREANWWWVAFAALLVQTPRLAQSLSTLGASPRPLPLGPVYTLQLAISHINLAVPSSAARLAVNVQIFQRQGEPSGSAVAVGAVDSVAGFVVQVSLLASILLFSNVSLDLQLEPDTSGRSGGLLAALALVAIVAGGAVLVVGPWRRAVVAKAAGPLRDAWGVVRGLRSARRWAMLLGGNLAAEILFASSLGGFARAFGYDVGLGELLLINVSTALLAGFMPVPGGIGITEGALTVGLTAAGLPESTAF